jgi:hypothetical protein
LDKQKFAKAAADCKKVTKWLKIPIQFEYDNNEPPVFSNTEIRFNGVNDEGHETFSVSQVYSPSFRQEKDGKLFHFCKTARKNYDTAVTACLIVLKHYFKDDFMVSSDGNPEEWGEGRHACQASLNYGEIPLVDQTT